MIDAYPNQFVKEAKTVENAVANVLNCGYRTADIAADKSVEPLSTAQMTEKILAEIK